MSHKAKRPNSANVRPLKVSIGTLSKCLESEIDLQVRAFIVVVTLLALFCLPFAGSADHAFDLHAAAAAESHADGYHSHGADEAQSASHDTDHHPADHTHEKAFVLVALVERAMTSEKGAFARHIPEARQERLYDIHRPPRTLS